MSPRRSFVAFVPALALASACREGPGPTTAPSTPDPAPPSLEISPRVGDAYGPVLKVGVRP